MDRSLLLLSNSRDAEGRFLVHAREALAAQLTGVREAVFVPFAAVTISYDAYLARVRPVFDALGVTLSGLHTHARPRETLAEAPAVIVGGGNTLRLLERLQHLEVLAVLRTRVSGGMPYVGWSAGSVLAGPSISTTNDMPIVWPPAGLAGLGVIGCHLNAHFTDAHPPGFRGETRRERLAEFLALQPGARVVGLPEGSWLEVSGAAITLGGPHDAPCFRASGVVTLSAGARVEREVEPDRPVSLSP
jgi:dipeptidase E